MSIVLACLWMPLGSQQRSISIMKANDYLDKILKRTGRGRA